MTEFQQRFQDTLSTRNEAQRKAIDTIYGPVLVVAGPGTGKTDVLGLRIGNILAQTDADIQSILCLTYTEAGAVEMRKRLVRYIGPEAYNAAIFTFHGFCNMVIHENLRYFDVYTESQPVSDLEKFQLLREMLDALPFDHPVRRNSGRRYYETTRLDNLFSTMKQEGWTPAFLKQKIADHLKNARESEDFIYKRASKKYGKSYEKGDFKDWQYREKVEQPMQILGAAVDLFDEYNNKLADRNRYDYHDMLIWVRDAFVKSEGLLAQYQERFQFFLVDEFQDTNGIQLELLKLLAEPYTDMVGGSPDIFVVGDDDQSIFRFQGAMMENIVKFKESYQPDVVVLTDNYRSSQTILDAATAVIENNSERLVAQYPEYTKDLTARSAHAGLEAKPTVRVFDNWAQEQIHLSQELTDLYEQGILETESVAVIYRAHKQVEDIVRVLENRRVPLNVKRPVNVLYEPVVRHVLLIFEYLSTEYAEVDSGEHLLYEICNLGYFNITLRDVGRLATECRYIPGQEKRAWRQLMSDRQAMEEAGIESISEINHLDNLLTDWFRILGHSTLPVVLQEVVTRGEILSWAMNSSNRSWQLQVLKTLFDYVRAEVERVPDMPLDHLIHNISLMKEYSIPLPVSKILTDKQGVHFITAHSAKGMEFDRVYMIGCTHKHWNKKRNSMNSYTFPDIDRTTEGGGEQDERRLFYVAMTRARKELVMSHHLVDDAGRNAEQSRFIEEARANGTITDAEISVVDSIHDQALVDMLTARTDTSSLYDRDLTDRVMETFVMSASALNAYLECPRRFYFQYILKVPSAPQPYFKFGESVHKALEEFIENHVSKNSIEAGADKLVEYFDLALRRRRSVFSEEDYKSYRYRGEEILRTYFDARNAVWTIPDRSIVERRITNGHHKSVPIKGVIDRIDVFADHVVVTDYKTGNPDRAGGKLRPPKNEDDIGGNYWRQMVFYKFLVDTDPTITKPLTHAFVEFIEPDKNDEYPPRKVEIAPAGEDFVSRQLVDTYEAIKAYKFEDGCEQPECVWCRFVKNNFQVTEDYGPAVESSEYE